MLYALYIASLLGAIALYMMMPRRGYNPRRLGALLGAATVGGLWLWLSRNLPEDVGIAGAAFAYQYVFSAIAIAAAVRVITHAKPVYAALWFVMVVLASAGLFLTLGAEFMAFAMVIIYAGAILVTYVFVIMLASTAGEGQGPDAVPEYDRVAREPVGAITAGFVLLAALLAVAFEPMQPNPRAASDSDEAIGLLLSDRAIEHAVLDRGDAAILLVEPIDNTERIGLDLFRGHPLGIELAGVILLVSLIGAVVIARQSIEPVQRTQAGQPAGRFASPAKQDPTSSPLNPEP